MPADRWWLYAHPHMRTRHRLSIPNARPVLLLDRCRTLVRPSRRFGRSRLRVEGALPRWAALARYPQLRKIDQNGRPRPGLAGAVQRVLEEPEDDPEHCVADRRLAEGPAVGDELRQLLAGRVVAVDQRDHRPGRDVLDQPASRP